jgi:hypothetical protein
LYFHFPFRIISLILIGYFFDNTLTFRRYQTFFDWWALFDIPIFITPRCIIFHSSLSRPAVPGQPITPLPPAALQPTFVSRRNINLPQAFRCRLQQMFPIIIIYVKHNIPASRNFSYIIRWFSSMAHWHFTIIINYFWFLLMRWWWCFSYLFWHTSLPRRMQFPLAKCTTQNYSMCLAIKASPPHFKRLYPCRHLSGRIPQLSPRCWQYVLSMLPLCFIINFTVSISNHFEKNCQRYFEPSTTFYWMYFFSWCLYLWIIQFHLLKHHNFTYPISQNGRWPFLIDEGTYINLHSMIHNAALGFRLQNKKIWCHRFSP